jgi:hypothetical protein
MLSPELAAIATYIFAAADSMLPSALLAKAIDALRRASDPATPPATAFPLNQLLDAAYQPLLDRFAGAPPKHWTPWATMAADAAGLVRTHLGNAIGNAKSDAAVEAVAQFRSEFTSLVRMATANGWDDTIAPLVAPSFAWPKPRAA